MNPVKFLALLVALLVIVKLVTVFIRPEKWLDTVKKIYSKPSLVTIAALAAAIITLRILLRELTIVQIFASLAFFISLTMLATAAYSQELVAFSEKALKGKDVVKKAWLSITVWIILLIWVLKVLLA